MTGPERSRILVVDDEEAILETMTYTFEDDVVPSSPRHREVAPLQVSLIPEVAAPMRPARVFAAQRGATVIAVTNPASDLARSASILFPCRVIEDTNVFTPTSSRLGQLALLDALLVALALTRGSGATERLRLSKDALQHCQ